MLNDLGMDLVYEKRFCDAYKDYLEDHEGRQLLQRMKAAEIFSLRERSSSEHDKREYQHVVDFLADKFPDKPNEQVVSFDEK
jgi:hypothetical protein